MTVHACVVTAGVVKRMDPFLLLQHDFAGRHSKVAMKYGDLFESSKQTSELCLYCCAGSRCEVDRPLLPHQVCHSIQTLPVDILKPQGQFGQYAPFLVVKLIPFSWVLSIVVGLSVQGRTNKSQ